MPDPDKLFDEAMALLERGRLDDARRLLETLCQAADADADAWLMLGAVHGETGAHAEARRCLERCIALDPDCAEGHFSLGMMLQVEGDIAGALRHLRRALALDPGLAEAAQALQSLQPPTLPAGAATGAGSAERLPGGPPASPSALPPEALAGAQHLTAGRYQEALPLLAAASAAAPGAPEVHTNYGLALHYLGRHGEAEQALRTALSLRPDMPEALCNLGLTLLASGRLEEALAASEQALSGCPELAPAHNVAGMALYRLGRLVQARSAFEKAVALNPDDPDQHWNLSLSLLLDGEFERGWQEYEWRWRRRETPARQLPQRAWNGEPVTGKTVLLYFEQGFGDGIQFVRYARQLREMGARVVVECPGSLAGLIRTADGVADVVAQGDWLPWFDLHAPLLSLPRLLGTTLATIPAQTPYLSVPPGDYTAVTAPIERNRARLNIGIVWAGRPEHPNDSNRSCALSAFQELADLSGVRLFSLQKGPRADDLKAFGSAPAIIDIGSSARDFADTAAAIAALDLVITVDTSVAHLAGALGKPVWILLPDPPDWRWLLERPDSPWYPTARLFRQTEKGDWTGVFARVRAALQMWREG